MMPETSLTGETGEARFRQSSFLINGNQIWKLCAIERWGADRMAGLTVNLSERSYDIVVEKGALREIGSWVAGLSRGRQALIVADENSADFFGANALAAMQAAGMKATMLVLPPGEESKTLAGADKVYEAAIRAGLDRTGTIVALGGGVIGDLAGFAAATYLRGN